MSHVLHAQSGRAQNIVICASSHVGREHVFVPFGPTVYKGIWQLKIANGILSTIQCLPSTRTILSEFIVYTPML